MEGTCPECGYSKEFDVSADVLRVRECNECGYTTPEEGFDGETTAEPGNAAGRHVGELLAVEYVALN